MANRLLRSFAVKIGAGLATGFNLTLATRQLRSPVPDLSLPVPDLSTLNPILTRIENIESRVMRVELTPSQLVVPAPEEIAALGTLLSSQSEDIAGLRQDIERIERRNAERAEAFGQKVAQVEKQVPAHIEASVNAKMAELEQRLRGEFQDMHHRTVDAFVAAIENKVVGRITALESSLVEQSNSIGMLREKSLKTDDNLQRLLDAVEKLCARAEAQAHIALVTPAPAPEPRPEVHPAIAAGPVVESFETHYQRALTRDARASVEAEAEPELVFASNGRSAAAPRRAMKSVGMAILGLAILGFRYIR